MFLTHLSLTNFRAFSRLDMDVPRRILLLQGDNAQGKTSLLEAIYFFSTFASIQASNDRQAMNFLTLGDNLSVARMVASFERSGQDHQIEIRLILEENGESTNKRFRKEILLDGVKRTAHQVVGNFNSVIFLPQMTRIIEGGPDERRRYLNLALAQIVPDYARSLSDYAQAIGQRNALLKQLAERNTDPQQLEYWDELLAKQGAFILFARNQAVTEIESLAVEIHRALTNGQEILNLNYIPALSSNSVEVENNNIGRLTSQPFSGLSVADIEINFQTALKNKQREEINRGITTIGPHRDELRFFANQVDLGDFGSRGQIRTTILSLKLAEVAWMHQKTGQYPILLMDETMAELDHNRRLQLLDSINQGQQAILTTTDLKLFDTAFIKQHTIWFIKKGVVTDISPAGN